MKIYYAEIHPNFIPPPSDCFTIWMVEIDGQYIHSWNMRGSKKTLNRIINWQTVRIEHSSNKRIDFNDIQYYKGFMNLIQKKYPTKIRYGDCDFYLIRQPSKILYKAIN